MLAVMMPWDKGTGSTQTERARNGHAAHYGPERLVRKEPNYRADLHRNEKSGRR